jgi:hypothetical protein
MWLALVFARGSAFVRRSASVDGFAFVVLAFALLAFAGRARAEVPPGSTIAIEYVAPSVCPDEISLRAGVIARLGRDPFFGDSDRKAFIDVKQTAAGFVAAIELREAKRGASRRAIGPTSKCEDAVNALELALAVIIDPAYSSSSQQSTTRAATQPLPPPVSSSPTDRTVRYSPNRVGGYEPPGWRNLPSPDQAPPAPPKHEIAFAIGGLNSQHPSTALAFSLRAAYLLPEWRIGVQARLSSATGVDDELNLRANQTEVLGEGCRRQGFFLLCAAIGVGNKSVEIGDYNFDPMSADRSAEYSKVFFETAFSAALEIPLGTRAFLRPTAELALPLPAVKIESLGVERYQVGFGQIGFDLSLGYRW